MSELKDFLDETKNKYNLDIDYKIYNIEEPLLEKKYGTIKIVKMNLSGDRGTIAIIPGFSFKSFSTMLKKLFEGFEYIKDKFTELYMICWSPQIKEIELNNIKDVLDKKTQYRLNEQYRIEMAHLIDKIFRSQSITNFTLMGKSAGGTVAMYIASMNKEVKTLLLCCPGSNEKGKSLANRTDLEIKLSWNRDDDVIPFSISDEYIKDFINQKNKYTFYSYDEGGHELNVDFLKEV